jgi:AI-2 transport protein TqsA
MTVRIDNPVALRVVSRANPARMGTVLTSFGGLVLLCYGLYIAAWLVNTLVLTLLLALVVSPILFGLRRRGWPAWAAVLGAFLVVFGITMAFLVLGLISLSRMDDNLPFYQQRLAEIATNVGDRLNATNPPLYDLSTIRADFAQQYVQYLVPLAFNVAGLAGSLLLYMFLLLYAFGEVFVMPDRLRHLTRNDPVILEQLRRFGDDMRSFFKLNAVMGAVAALADLVVLLALGVDFALLWGMLAFLLSFIPNIGFIISMMAPALMALIQYGPREAVLVIIAYSVINLLFDYVLRPRIIGKDLNQSQILTFVAVIVWGVLLGPTGALLSVPLTLITKLILEMATGTAQYSALIVEELPLTIEGEVPVIDGEAPVVNGEVPVVNGEAPVVAETPTQLQA